MDAVARKTISVSSETPASGSGAKGAAGAAEAGLPNRFYEPGGDTLAREIEDLENPWNLGAIEARIERYTRISDDISAKLSASVIRNYNDFVQGMQQVQAVETELTLIGVLVKNGRRKLQERDMGIVCGSLHIKKQHRKSRHLKELLATLEEFQEVVKMEAELRHCLGNDDYCQAISRHSDLRKALAAESFGKFPALVGLREGLNQHHGTVRRNLGDGLRVAAISSEFDERRYEQILRAYAMMAPDQSFSVGKELLRHVVDSINTVSRQCTLAFSPAPSSESPMEWHRRAQLKDLCRGMDPTHFVACTAQLYEHLCDFLYRHQFLCHWHSYRSAQVSEDPHAKSSGFAEVLRDVLTELTTSKRIVWDRIQQQVSLVLMTLDFQYPALSEDNFLHILHLTNMLVEEGDAFMADYQLPHGSEGRRHFSSPIRNTLKTKGFDYFESLHYHVWVSFKLGLIEQDSWQRLPVPRSYHLIRAERLRVAMPQSGDGARLSASTAVAEDSVPKLRTAESNPFRNYKPEPLLPMAVEVEAQSDAHGIRANRDSSDEMDEHALLQHWIDESENLSMGQIGSSMLSNSNLSPVVSASTVELARILERYLRMMGTIPTLAIDIFQSAVQLIDFYIYCVLCLFVPDKQLRTLLEDLDSIPTSDNQLQAMHEAFLLQKLCPDLRRAVTQTREVVSSTALPPAVANNLGLSQPGVTAESTLLQLMPFHKLSSPSCLCGLAERCIGAESVGAVLNDMKNIRQWLLALLKRGCAQEEVDRFFAEHDLIASQLRTFVLRSAAKDVLEVNEVGRVSLSIFANTVQALNWSGRDFSQGSPAAAYVEQLRAQIDELARRIPCAGGGAVPFATQRTVWGWMEVRVMHECLEVVAKCGRKKSMEAIFCMAEDFQSIRGALGQHLRSTDGAPEASLLPQEHMLASTISWTYLDQYLEAHCSLSTDAMVWCKRHPEFPLHLHKALLDYLFRDKQKALKQIMTELEAFLSTYLVDESVPVGHRAL